MAYRIPYVLAVFALISCLIGAQHAGAAPSPGPITASSAIVVEPTTGDVVFARAPDKRLLIASATKLMTALLVLERADLTRVLPAANYHAELVESRIDLRPGEKMSIVDLTRAMLIVSANDAAATLAEGLSGSTTEFVKDMNRRARELGLKNTRFANPIGLDDRQNYSTARDLVTLTRRLLKFEFFRTAVAQEKATLKTGDHRRQIENSNRLLGRYPWITGAKTGHTSEAGYVLVGTGRPQGIDLISVVLDTPTEDVRSADTLRLLRWAATRYRIESVVRRGAVLATVPIRYRGEAQLDLVADKDLELTIPIGKKAVVRTRGMPSDVDGPIKTGQELGAVDVYIGSKRMASTALVANAAVQKAGLWLRFKAWYFHPLPIILTLAAGLGVMLLWWRRLRYGRRRLASSNSGSVMYVTPGVASAKRKSRAPRK